MNKVFLVFVLLGLTIASNAQQSVDEINKLAPQDSLENKTNSTFLTPQALVYKQRLDSIQQTVVLDYNEYVQQYIDMYIKRKSMYADMLGKAAFYFPIFEKSLIAYKVPEEIKYLAVVESSLNPHAVSRVGATGLWQFMFRTAKDYGLRMDNFVDERKDPTKASQAAASYLRNAYNQLGDWILAIASYNCGLSNVNRAIEKSGSRNFWELRAYLPAETRDYVPAFIAATYIMKQHKTHHINPSLPIFTFKVDTVEIRHFVSLNDIAKTIHYSEETITALNPSFKKGIINGTDSTPKSLVIPKPEHFFYEALYQVLNADIETDKNIIDVTLDDIYREQQKRKLSIVGTPKSDMIIHQVKKGQTLSQIAKKYKVTVKELRLWNKLDEANLVVGQLIKIKTEYSST